MAVFSAKNEHSRRPHAGVASEGQRPTADDETLATSTDSERPFRRSYLMPTAASASNHDKLIKKLVAFPWKWRSRSLSDDCHGRQTTKSPVIPRLEQLKNAFVHKSDTITQHDSPKSTACIPQAQEPVTSALNEEIRQDDSKSHISLPALSHESTTFSEESSSNESDSGRHRDSESVSGSLESSEIDAEIFPTRRDRVIGHMTKIRDTRDEIRDAFKRVKTERTHLQDIRKSRNDAYQRVKLAVQAAFPTNPDFQELFQQLDTLDLSYQHAEIVVDDLVDVAQQRSLRLELEERKFFTHLVESETSSESGDLSRTPSRETLLGIWSERSEDLHPLLEDLQDSLNEIELAKETQIEVEDSLQAVRVKPSAIRTEKDLLLMDDLERVRLQTQKDFHHWSARAELLEKECREQNLLKAGHRIQERIAANRYSPLEDIYLEEFVLDNDEDDEVGPQGNPGALAHPKFGVLLSNPSHLLKNPPETAKKSLRSASLPEWRPQRQSLLENATKEIEIESLLAPTTSGDKSSFVNRWLLHILRLSPLEAELLLVQFRSVLQIRDGERWQRDVLYYWSRDDATILNAFKSQEVSSYTSRSSDLSSRHSTATDTNPTGTALPA